MTVNSHETALGDTVTYEVHAISCTSKVQAIDISIYYDSTSLRLVEGSFETPAVSGAITNTDLLGEIRLNAISVEGFDFSSDSIIAKVKFEVVDDLSSDISLYYNVKNFLDENKTELKDTYTFDMTNVSSENGSAIVSKPSSNSESKGSKPESAVASSEADLSSENEVEIDLSASSSANTSSVTQGDDIPSDKAIRIDTPDTTPAVRHTGTTKLYWLIMLCGVGIVVLIGVVFTIIIKDNGGKGSHYSK